MSVLEELRASDLDKASKIYLGPLENRDEVRRKQLIGKWLGELFFQDFRIPSNHKADILFFRSLTRPDYKALFHEIISASGASGSIIVEDYCEPSSRLNRDLRAYIIENIDHLSVLDIKDLEVKTAVAFQLCRDAYIVEKVLANEFKVFVSFSDMQSVDYIAACYFKRRQVTTVSLQHGLYVDYGNIDTINVINYENHASDYILTWGSDTSKLIKKYHSSAHPVICGKPNLRRLPAEETAKKINRLLVVFDQEIFAPQNIEMYKISTQLAKEIGVKIAPRFHPHNNIPAYEKHFGRMVAEAEVRPDDLIVGHSSSLLYELSAEGRPAMRFVSDIPAPPFPSEFSFRTIEDARSVWEYLSANEAGASNAADSLIAYVGNDSKQQYENFFLKFIAKERQPRFSIIVPTFNSDRTLQRAIDSIQSQTFDDFEVIIMDGVSSDWSLQIAKDAERDDPRFRVFSSQDSGVYDAMNAGIEHARGEYLLFIGSDDRIHDPLVLENIDREIGEACPDFVYGDVNVVGKVKWAPEGGVYGGEFDQDAIKQRNICHQGIFYRRKKMLQIGKYNLKYKLCADWDMNMRFFAYARTRRVNTVVADFYAGGMSTEGGDPVFGKDFKAKKIKYFGSA